MKPQLAYPADSIPTGDWVLEPKMDGIRLLAFVEASGVTFFTRDANAKVLPRIAKELSQLPPNTWVDGEAVHPSGVWNKAQSGVQSGNDTEIQFVVFDLLMLNNIDARSLPLSGRRDLLGQIFDAFEFERVKLIPQFEATQEMHEQLLAIGFEGSVVKRPGAPYQPGRSRSWLKIKFEDTLDAVVTGYQAGKDVGTILFSQYSRDGALVYRGRAKALKGLDQDIERRIRDKQVVEIKFNGIMPSGALRHPQVLRVRTDKPAAECLL